MSGGGSALGGSYSKVRSVLSKEQDLLGSAAECLFIFQTNAETGIRSLDYGDRIAVRYGDDFAGNLSGKKPAGNK